MTGPDPRRYADAYQGFDLDEAWSWLAGSQTAGLNAAIECCDRHAGQGRPALRWIGRDGTGRTLDFDWLRERSMRVAALLRDRGIGPDDRVAVLLPRIPDLVAVALGIWRVGAVYQPLFTALGAGAIEQRLRASSARLVVCDGANRPKLDALASPALPIAVVGGDGAGRPGDIDLGAWLGRDAGHVEPVLRAPDDPFLLMSTSGTSGAPKSLLVPLRALVAFVGYMRDAIDLRPDDRYWNLADPGWAYGLYYAIVGPLALGCRTLLHEGAFEAGQTVAVIRDEGITNLAGAPTAFRLLKAAGAEAVAPIAGRLRVVSSAGEPLDADTARWFERHFRMAVRDHYGQTELGMVLCDHHALTSGRAAARPVPGMSVVVLGPDDQERAAGEAGALAVDRDCSPLFWFGGYQGTPSPASSRYYRSGDEAVRAPDGSIAVIGRADDVITSAGYRIGPSEVEAALLEHPSVAEAAVVGKPDPDRTEIVKAFVVPRPGVAPTDHLATVLQRHVRERLSAHAYPREIAFVAELPKTSSGKVQRALLREKG